MPGAVVVRCEYERQANGQGSMADQRVVAMRVDEIEICPMRTQVAGQRRGYHADTCVHPQGEAQHPDPAQPFLGRAAARLVGENRYLVSPVRQPCRKMTDVRLDPTDLWWVGRDDLRDPHRPPWPAAESMAPTVSPQLRGSVNR